MKVLRRNHKPVAESNCVDREDAWRATGSEMTVRRMTNTIRHDGIGSLRVSDEPNTCEMGVKKFHRILYNVVGDRMSGMGLRESRDT